MANVFSLHLLLLLWLVFCLASPSLLLPAIADDEDDGAPVHLITTTLLDVESSLQKTLQVVQAAGVRASYHNDLTDDDDDEDRVDDTDYNKHRFPVASSSVYSVPLLSRSAVFPTTYPDYRSLTMARLKRDWARAKWVQDRLDPAAGWTAKTEEIPDPTLSSSEVRFGGNSSNEYLVLLGIGASLFHLSLDTGSEITWVRCSLSNNQTESNLVPSQSPTYTPIPCDPDQCKSSRTHSSWCGQNNKCSYWTGYADGSSSQGDLAMESVTLGDPSVPVHNITIGCGRSNPGMPHGGASAGIMGLNGGPLSFPTQMNATSFSYCLVDMDDISGHSTLVFSGQVDDDGVVANLKMFNDFYQIDLVGISVGGVNRINVSGDVVVDSGTVVSRLPADVYNSFREAFVANMNLTTVPPTGPMDTCFNMSGVDMTKVPVPTVSFHFSNGQKLQLPAKNYLTPVDSSGTHCLAFAPAPTALSIIGNVQQQGIRVTYDLRGSVFRFTPGNC